MTRERGLIGYYRRQRKAECQSTRKHPVSGSVAHPASKTGVNENILPRCLPDDAQECGIIWRASPSTLAVDFPHQPQFWSDWQLCDKTPNRKRIRVRPIDTTAEVYMVGQRLELSAQYPYAFKAKAFFVFVC